jgi:hypothetical protein
MLLIEKLLNAIFGEHNMYIITTMLDRLLMSIIKKLKGR